MRSLGSKKIQKECDRQEPQLIQRGECWCYIEDQDRRGSCPNGRLHSDRVKDNKKQIHNKMNSEKEL